MPRRQNIPIWAGFVIVLLALVSYIPIFTVFPLTRDVPWANYLLFLLGGGVLAWGLTRAFRDPEHFRGKISGSILGALALLLFGFFCFGIFYIGKQVPSPDNALHAGQPAPSFTLSNAQGKPVALSDLVKSHRAVLLIFYRGYW
ncbi:MAG TPA: hypothetical protein VEV17_22435 [Bryobacteraceae bacterium]|nr:hypothetical protein [Bryobacteraceae bacterium]